MRWFSKLLFTAILCLPLVANAQNLGPPSGSSSPSGAAGGDLSGTYPNPSVAKVNGNTPGGACSANNFASSLSTSAVPSCAIPGANAATLQASPANPTGTTSATQVMMGLGTTCKLTPVYSGRIYVHFQGNLSNTITGDGATIQLRFGTGVAPANAAAATGTTVGSSIEGAVNPAGWVVLGAVSGIITGLTPGTAYWFDVGLLAPAGAGTASYVSISCDAFEF